MPRRPPRSPMRALERRCCALTVTRRVRLACTSDRRWGGDCAGGGGAGGGGAGHSNEAPPGDCGGFGEAEAVFARGGESASLWERAGGVYSRWCAAVARGTGLTVRPPAGEAECEGCGLVPTDHGSGVASRTTTGVASAGGRAGPLERRTGTKIVAPRAPARTLPAAASANDSAWSTSRCTVAFQQWVPAIEAPPPESLCQPPRP
eukprot:scaffold8935_cov69-Phaeocystis_antarctica.AAC.1